MRRGAHALALLRLGAAARHALRLPGLAVAAELSAAQLFTHKQSDYGLCACARIVEKIMCIQIVFRFLIISEDFVRLPKKEQVLFFGQLSFQDKEPPPRSRLREDRMPRLSGRPILKSWNVRVS